MLQKTATRDRERKNERLLVGCGQKNHCAWKFQNVVVSLEYYMFILHTLHTVNCTVFVFLKSIHVRKIRVFNNRACTVKMPLLFMQNYNFSARPVSLSSIHAHCSSVARRAKITALYCYSLFKLLIFRFCKRRYIANEGIKQARQIIKAKANVFVSSENSSHEITFRWLRILNALDAIFRSLLVVEQEINWFVVVVFFSSILLVSNEYANDWDTQNVREPNQFRSSNESQIIGNFGSSKFFGNELFEYVNIFGEQNQLFEPIRESFRAISTKTHTFSSGCAHNLEENNERS